jgi:hypothetical protein
VDQGLGTTALEAKIQEKDLQESTSTLLKINLFSISRAPREM